MKKISLLFILTCIVTLFSGCNNTEDVKSLVTGKTWRLSCFYYKNGNKAIDRYPNADKTLKDNLDGFHVIFYENNTFEGRCINNRFSGTWKADGKTNEFSIDVTRQEGTDAEAIAIDFFNAIKGVVSYKCDNSNLSLYYKDKNEYMTFYVKKPI